jgi:TolB protein
MAGDQRAIAEADPMAADPSSVPSDADAQRRFAWIATGVGALVTGGFTLLLWALVNELTLDVALSAYHVPLYLGVLALAIGCVVLAVRARREGRDWRRPLPRGYGVMAVGAALFVAGFVLDAGWREGVGFLYGIEESLGPSRVVIAIALALIAVGPLHAAIVRGSADVSAAAAALSAAFTIAAIGWVGGFNPAQSPWLARDPDLPQLRADLWMMDADGRNQTRVLEAEVDTNIGFVSWAPDGSQVSYTVFQLPSDGTAVTEAGIWAAAADGTDAHALVGGSDWTWIPRFTPDGRTVLYTQEAPGGPFVGPGPLGPGVGAGPQGPLSIPLPNADLWTVDAAGDGEPHRLTDGDGDDRAPVPSPDGSRILFDSTRDGNTEIYVVDADGTNARRLTDDPGEDWGASWSPDGTQIAFNSSRSGDFEIYVMDADGRNVRQITSGDGPSVTPTWSPDGDRIAFTLRDDDGSGQVWSIAVDGSDRRDLSRNRSTDDQVWTGGWGPDGRIVFNRGPLPSPEASPLVRLDFGAAAMLLSALVMAGTVALLARIAPPLGSFTVALTTATVLVAAPAEAWSLVPAGLAAGLATDLAAWRSPPRFRARVAGATASGAFVIAVGIAVILTAGLEWTPTLWIGVVVAAGAAGWALGAIAELGRGGAVASA